MSVRTFLAFVAWTWLAPVAFAQIVLFQDGQQVVNYNNEVLTIEPGSRLKFSAGEQFEIAKVLGHGNATLVLLTKEGQALRIPLWRGRRSSTEPFDYSLYKREGKELPTWLGPTTQPEYLPYDDRFEEIHRDYGATYRQLQQAGVQTVAINEERSVPGEYYVVEYFPVQLTLDQALSNWQNYAPAEQQRMLDSLEILLKSTYKLAVAGDFAPRQIGFDGKQWKLLDWRGGCEASTGAGMITVLQGLKRAFGDAGLKDYIEGVEYEVRGLRVANGDALLELQDLYNQSATRKSTSSNTNRSYGREEPACEGLAMQFFQF